MIKVPVDLYLQVLNRKYLKIISITIFDELFIYYFSYKINIFVSLYKKHNT